MEFYYGRNIKIKGEFDVAVCGSGSAGFTAAVAAARLGAAVCVIEKNSMPGGVMTAGRNNDIALFNAGKRPVVRGIGWEFVNRLGSIGFADIPEFKDGIRHSRQGVRVNIPAAANMIDIMFAEDGVKPYYMTTLVDMIKEPGGWLCVTADKGGLGAVRARRVIDCTGDGDACVFAGAGYEIGGENGELQPGTLGFYMDIFGEDGDRESVTAAYEKAVSEGRLHPGDVWPSGATPMLAADSRGINVNHITVGNDYQERRSELEIEGRSSVARINAFYRGSVNTSSYRAQACGLACETALRETRRIICDKKITAQDYINAVKYADGLCLCYYPIDLHTDDPKKSLYNIFLDGSKIPSIPYGAILPVGTENLLVAGRCICGDRLAQSAYRVKASCMAMGQAAGAAAAVSAAGNIGLREVRPAELRKILREQGAIVPEE